jgi:hypothetical protein
MQFTSKLSPEQWAEARRLRADGATFAAIGRQFGVLATTIGGRANKEQWPAPVRAAAKRRTRTRPGPASAPATGIRTRLALRLYRVIECRIELMELRMIRQLQAHTQSDVPGGDGTVPPPAAKEERESFAALIESINKVTEIASEPAPAADGKRRAASRTASPELAALSDDIDPDGLAAASEKDALRRDIAERLAKIFPPS